MQVKTHTLIIKTNLFNQYIIKTHGRLSISHRRQSFAQYMKDMSIIQALRMQKQEDQQLKAILRYSQFKISLQYMKRILTNQNYMGYHKCVDNGILSYSDFQKKDLSVSGHSKRMPLSYQSEENTPILLFKLYIKNQYTIRIKFA